LGARQKIWAKKARLQLIQQLGGACVRCGAKRKLELDHIIPRDYKIEKYGSDRRISIYRREAAEGKLQVLCAKCNKAKQLEDMLCPSVVSVEKSQSCPDVGIVTQST